jgi:hypothetical protein
MGFLLCATTRVFVVGRRGRTRIRSVGQGLLSIAGYGEHESWPLSLRWLLCALISRPAPDVPGIESGAYNKDAGTRQGALANGLNRLNPQKTGTCNLQEHAAKPVREGLQKIVRPSGEIRLINRLNLGVMRAVGLYPINKDKSWQRAETLRFTLARSWENEK